MNSVLFTSDAQAVQPRRPGATATVPQPRRPCAQPRHHSHGAPVHSHGATPRCSGATATVPQPRLPCAQARCHSHAATVHGAPVPQTPETIVICEQLKSLVSHAIDFPSASVRTPLDNQARLVLVAFFWCIICVLLIIAEICRPNVRDFLMVLISKGLPRRPGVVTLGTGSSSCLLLLTYRFLA